MQYLKRAYESRLELLSRDDIRDVIVRVSPDPDEKGGIKAIFEEDLIVVDWTVLCDRIKIDAHDELKPDRPGGSGPRIVYRSEYEYHATLLRGENIMRMGGPDEGKSPPVRAEYYNSSQHNHHSFHHVDKFHPLTSEDVEQSVQDVRDTPDVQDFIKKVLGGYHAKKNQIN